MEEASYPTSAAAGRAAPAHSVEAATRWAAFRTYWVGQLLSIVGDHFTLIALPLAAQVVTGSAFVVGLVVFAETFSTVVGGPFAGAFTDRRDPIGVMVTTDIARAVLLVILAVLSAAGALSGLLIVLSSFLLGVLRLVHDGGEGSFVAAVVAECHDVRSQARITLSENVGSTVGPLGAGVAASVGVWVAFGVDAVTFVAAVAAVLFVARATVRSGLRDHLRPTASSGAHVGYLEDLRATAGIIRTQRDYVVILAVAAMFNLVTLPVGAQFIPLASGLGLGATGIGVMFALTGVAGILTAVVVERDSVIRPGQVVWWTGGLGVLTAAVGVYPTVWGVAVVFVAAGVAFTVVFTHFSAMRQRVFPQGVQGRVSLSSRTVLWSAVAFGALGTGWVSEVFGPASMWVVCGAAGVLSAVVASAFGALRISVR